VVVADTDVRQVKVVAVGIALQIVPKGQSITALVGVTIYRRIRNTVVNAVIPADTMNFAKRENVFV